MAPSTRRVSGRDFLSFFAERFDTVELNFSYYGMPRAEQLARLLETSGPCCLFSIKGHRSFTHDIDAARWRESLTEYRSALPPSSLPGDSAPSSSSFPNPSTTSRSGGATSTSSSGI